MLREIPFARLLIPFIIGISLRIAIPVSFSSLYILIPITIVLALSVSASILLNKWEFRWVFGVLIALFLIFMGYFSASRQIGSTSIPQNKNHTLTVKLLEPPHKREASYRALGQVQNYRKEEGWISVDEKVMLYFSLSDSSIEKLRYGTLLAVQTNLSVPGEPLNPYQFNYKRYLERQQIYQTGYVAPQGWMVLEEPTKSLYQVSFNLRNWLIDYYSRSGIEGENLAVLSAITLGYKNLLDEETRRVFSASGAMHILAVSGLHVGIIFATLSMLLIFLTRLRRGKLLSTGLLIGFLWFYAFFTGFSPSVVRASLMFSLMLIGNSLNRSSSVYNTLSASAFLVLAFDPLLILNIGFQLSYCAVLSIVFFYPYIYNMLYIKHKILDKVWALIAVSVAAQIGTFPLSIYHFHQFPNLFILSNLYAIPLAFLILYFAIGLIAVSPIPLVSSVVGWVLNWLLTILNTLTRFTESIPHSTTSAINISSFQLFLLVLSIILFGYFTHGKRMNHLFAGLLSLVLFFSIHFYSHSANYNQSELMILANRSAGIITYKHKDKLLIMTTEKVSEEGVSKYAYLLQGYLNNNRILFDNVQLQSIWGIANMEVGNLRCFTNSLGYWMVYDNKSILIPNQFSFSPKDDTQRIAVDYLVLTATSSDIDMVLSLIEPKVLVIDQTIPPWKVQRITTILGVRGIASHDVSRQGYLQL